MPIKFVRIRALQPMSQLTWKPWMLSFCSSVDNSFILWLALIVTNSCFFSLERLLPCRSWLWPVFGNLVPAPLWVWLACHWCVLLLKVLWCIWFWQLLNLLLSKTQSTLLFALKLSDLINLLKQQCCGQLLGCNCCLIVIEQ